MQPTPDYYALSAISQSALKVFQKNPLEYKHQFVDGNTLIRKETPSMLLGSLVHCMLFEPNEVERLYIPFDEERRPELDKGMTSNKNKAWKADIELACNGAGRNLVSQAVYEQADLMVQKLCAHTGASECMYPLEEGWEAYYELAILWQSQVSDQPLKSKLDMLLVNPGLKKARIVDYKTTIAGSAGEFSYSVRKYGYDIQAAFYLDAAKSWLMEHYPGVDFDMELVFVAQRTAVPYYILGLFKLGEDAISMAKAGYEDLLRDLEGRLHNNSWEEETNAVQVLGLNYSSTVAVSDVPTEELFSTEELLLP